LAATEVALKEREAELAALQRATLLNLFEQLSDIQALITGDARSRKLLKKVFAELEPGGTIAIGANFDNAVPTQNPLTCGVPVIPAYITAAFAVGDPIWDACAPSKKSGTKFNDLNNNGKKDPGEPGIIGWTVVLLANGTEANHTADESVSARNLDAMLAQWYDATTAKTSPSWSVSYMPTISCGEAPCW
jgi:hypothetical protein